MRTVLSLTLLLMASLFAPLPSQAGTADALRIHWHGDMSS